MMVIVLMMGGWYKFPYVNYKGEHEIRHVRLDGLDFGSNEWYPKDEWFMRTWDPSRGAARSFALSMIDARLIENAEAPES